MTINVEQTFKNRITQIRKTCRDKGEFWFLVPLA